MTRRTFGSGFSAGPADEPEGPGVSPEEFREALSRWASTVTVVAVREEGRVYATTVTSFVPLSAEPPRVLVSLGPGAQVLPFLGEGRRFAVNLLAGGHRRLASDFADAFPVGPSPFADEGDPVIPGSHVALVCRVDRVVPVDDHRIVIGLVTGAEPGPPGGPLLYYGRDYRTLG